MVRLNSLTYHLQRNLYWHPFGRAGLGKCYVEEEAHILLSLRSREGKGSLWPAYNGTFVKSLGKSLLTKIVPFLIQRLADDLLSFARRASSQVLEGHGQQQAMFVDVVEGMENVKQRVPSLVWADTAERFNSLMARAIYHSQTRDFPVLGVTSYWELGFGRDAGISDQTTGDVIQRAAEIMQDVADDQRNVHRDNTGTFAA